MREPIESCTCLGTDVGARPLDRRSAQESKSHVGLNPTIIMLRV